MNFVIIGPRLETASTRLGIFGDVVDGSVDNACMILPREPADWLGMKAEWLSKRRKLPIEIRRLVISPWEMKYREVARHLKKGEENCVIFCLNTTPFTRIPPQLILNLRVRKPKCKLVYYLVDGVDRISKVNHCSVEKLLSFMKQFDAVFTYDMRDAEKYGYHYLDSPTWKAPGDAAQEALCDVYFCGRDKGRRELLAEIARRLESEGMSYEFVVSEAVDDSVRRYLTVREWRPYPETVEEMRSARCVLEILAANNYGPSMRYREAVMYNKKLLTNNPDIARLPYYDPRWMKVFASASDIDMDWLRQQEPVDYGYRGDFSAECFLKKIEATLRGAD